MSVVLEDQTRPPVHVLGNVWACEWLAVAQPVTVRVAEQEFVLPFLEPMYRRPGAGTSAQDAGWFRSEARPDTPPSTGKR